ncbi:MAG: hypothetical protein ACP5C3_01470 [Methanomicrobiales archaeon]
MRPETEGKIMVAFIISLIAFSCGSGVGIVIGLSQNDSSSPFSLNFTEDKDPNLTPISPNQVTTDNKPANPSNGGNYQEVYVENPTKPNTDTNTDTNNQEPTNTQTDESNNDN